MWRLYSPVNPMGSCRARSVYLTTRFLGRLSPLKRLISIVHILSPETDNCPSWISGRERMTVENISWSISMKECCQPRQGLNPRAPGLQSDGASNWSTEAGTSNEYHNICFGGEIIKRSSTRQNLPLDLCDQQRLRSASISTQYGKGSRSALFS